jgi:hypothetical protein
MEALLNSIYNTVLYVVYILLIIAIILLIPTANVFASSESELFDKDGNLLYTQDRPAINQDFAPDYSCLFDAFQLKCIPGSAQKCPRPQFGNNEDNTCWPKTFINREWVRNCPDGYHTTDGDETGQCYPNSNGCNDAALLSEDRKHRFDYILTTGDDSPNPYDTCADPRYLCDPAETHSQSEHEGCKEFREWYLKYYSKELK